MKRLGLPDGKCFPPELYDFVKTQETEFLLEVKVSGGAWFFQAPLFCMNAVKSLLAELDSPDSCLVYDTHTKRAAIRVTHPGTSSLPMGVSVALEDIIVLFTNGWVTRSNGAGA